MSELYTFFDIGSEPDIENIKKNHDICSILLESPLRYWNFICMYTVKEALLNRADGVNFQKIHKIAQRTNNMRFVSLLCLLYTMTNHYILGYD